MLVAKLWKKDDIDTIEANIYRKTLKYANNIANKSILNIMSSSRLAGEVVISLAKGVWRQTTRQQQIDDVLRASEKRGINKDGDLKFRREETPCQRKAKVYVPRIILDMMAASLRTEHRHTLVWDICAKNINDYSLWTTLRHAMYLSVVPISENMLTS